MVLKVMFTLAVRNGALKMNEEFPLVDAFGTAAEHTLTERSLLTDHTHVAGQHTVSGQLSAYQSAPKSRQGRRLGRCAKCRV